MKDLMNYLNDIVPLSVNESSEILSFFKPEKIKKGDCFLDFGNVCTKIGFIKEGLLEMVYLEGTTEKIIDFFFPLSFATDYKSFLTAGTSETQIRTLKTTQMFVIEKQSLEKLYEMDIKFQKIGRVLAEKFYLEFAERIRLHTLSPKVRYDKLRMVNLEFIQQIPQYKIASYLDVTPEWLSKLRTK